MSFLFSGWISWGRVPLQVMCRRPDKTIFRRCSTFLQLSLSFPPVRSILIIQNTTRSITPAISLSRNQSGLTNCVSQDLWYPSGEGRLPFRGVIWRNPGHVQALTFAPVQEMVRWARFTS
jgi:hypothetical protein